jgi:hypothetical protein
VGNKYRYIDYIIPILLERFIGNHEAIFFPKWGEALYRDQGIESVRIRLRSLNVEMNCQNVKNLQ